MPRASIEQSRATATPRLARTIRGVVGLLVLKILTLLAFKTITVANAAMYPAVGEPATADELASLYAERMFYAVVVIGAGVSAHIFAASVE